MLFQVSHEAFDLSALCQMIQRKWKSFSPLPIHWTSNQIKTKQNPGLDIYFLSLRYCLHTCYVFFDLVLSFSLFDLSFLVWKQIESEKDSPEAYSSQDCINYLEEGSTCQVISIEKNIKLRECVSQGQTSFARETEKLVPIITVVCCLNSPGKGGLTLEGQWEVFSSSGFNNKLC